MKHCSVSYWAHVEIPRMYFIQFSSMYFKHFTRMYFQRTQIEFMGRLVCSRCKICTLHCFYSAVLGFCQRPLRSVDSMCSAGHNLQYFCNCAPVTLCPVCPVTLCPTPDRELKGAWPHLQQPPSAASSTSWGPFKSSTQPSKIPDPIYLICHWIIMFSWPHLIEAPSSAWKYMLRSI